jgi:endonuclease
MHVEGMATNSGARKHHRNIKPGSGHDLFFKVAPGRFRLWDPATDPQPLYASNMPSNQNTLANVPEDDESDEREQATEDASGLDGSREFAFERDLRNYLAKNLHLLERDLELYQDEEFSGVEFPVGGRFIDILAVDAAGRYVVIELKVSRGYERAIGQLLRYMGWIKANLADGKPVRGMIVASEITEDLKLAVSLVPDVQLFRYELAMKFNEESW